MKPKVVILGGGPGSVFSYYGAIAAGYTPLEIQVWAEGFSFPPGAFWLHELPPNTLCPFEPENIDIQLQGTGKLYSLRQWGKEYPTSVETYCGKVAKAYDPNKCIPWLSSVINFKSVDKCYDMGDVSELAEEHDLVVVTFPITLRAKSEISKLKVPVYHNRNPTLHTEHQGNYCLYNGMIMKELEWVRVTKAFGRVSAEYPHTMTHDPDYILECEERIWGKGGVVTLVPELHPEVKPIHNPVLGRKDNILLTGRWATLNRKALSHHSFYDVYSHITGKNYEQLPIV